MRAMIQWEYKEARLLGALIASLIAAAQRNTDRDALGGRWGRGPEPIIATDCKHQPGGQ